MGGDTTGLMRKCDCEWGMGVIVRRSGANTSQCIQCIVLWVNPVWGLGSSLSNAFKKQYIYQQKLIKEIDRSRWMDGRRDSFRRSFVLHAPQRIELILMIIYWMVYKWEYMKVL